MKKKILAGIVLLILIVAFAAFRNPIYWKPIQAPGKPLVANKDEIKIILLGTGSPLNNPLRAKPSQIVLAGDKYFLVDCGGATVDRLLAAEIPLDKIDNVFFTHHHSDHNSGFMDFFIRRWLSLSGIRNQALNVYGPPTTAAIIGAMMKALDFDINVRQAHVQHSLEGVKVKFTEMTEGVIYDDSQTKVTVFPVDHRPVQEAVGYRFEYKGKSVVFSGDTHPCENIVKYSRKADLLVHEAYNREWMETAKKKWPEKARLIDKVMEYHTLTLEVADMAQRAGVKHVALTHLMPAVSPVWYWERLFTKGMGGIYKGKISVGRDLMTFDLK